MRKIIFLIFTFLIILGNSQTQPQPKPTCSDNYKGLTPGWYGIRVNNGAGTPLFLTIRTGVDDKDYQWAKFITTEKAGANYPSHLNVLYINYTDASKQYIQISSTTNVENFLSPNNPIPGPAGKQWAFFGANNYFNADNNFRYNYALQIQNCSDGRFRIYTTFGGRNSTNQNGDRGYLGIDSPLPSYLITDILSDFIKIDYYQTFVEDDWAYFAGQNYTARVAEWPDLYPQLNYLTLYPWTSSQECVDTFLDAGKYTMSNSGYQLFSDGYVDKNSYQYEKGYSFENYNNIFTQKKPNPGYIMVERGPGKIHYFRTTYTGSSSAAYLTTMKTVKSKSSYQWAIMADVDYISANLPNTNKELYIQKCMDGGLRVYSLNTASSVATFKAYLSVDQSPDSRQIWGDYPGNPKSYFGGDLYSGALKRVSFSSYYQQACATSDQIDSKSVTFYMIADLPYRQLRATTFWTQITAFLYNQAASYSCPQTFLGMAGGSAAAGGNFIWAEKQRNKTYPNQYVPYFKGYIADVLGQLDINQIQNVSDKYFASARISSTTAKFTLPSSLKFFYQDSSFLTYGSINGGFNYQNYYALGLYNTKTNIAATGRPIAYYVAIHGNLDDSRYHLFNFKTWYKSSNNPYRNSTIPVPIILVTHNIESTVNTGDGAINLNNFAKDLNVAAILHGHTGAVRITRYSTWSQVNDGSQVNGNGKIIPIINVGGAEDFIFNSISLNANKVKILRRVWTDKAPGFLIGDSQLATTVDNTYVYR